MLVVDKARAAYLRKNLKGVCIYRTMKSKGSARRGSYYVEETSAVLRLLSKYDDGQKVIEEYPVSK